MAQRVRAGRVAVVLGAALLLVVALAVVVLVRGGAGSGSAGKDQQVRIPVGGGVSVAAEVVRPRGPGRFPLVVLPTSLGSTLTEYHGFIGELVRDGFAVVTYVQRGFHDSGGAVDFAAAPTQRDFSRVLDWTLAHERVDPHRVGAFGRSYGAGISLLAAARDARVRAVVATSGWADFAGAFDPGGTASAYALPLLLSSVRQTGRAGPELARLQDEYRRDPAAVGATVQAMSASRSPDRLVDQLNRHRTAIMLASGFDDSVLPPASLIPFFTALTGPKRLQLAPGDHGGPEAAGLLGRPDPVTDAARRWLERYVQGVRNGIDREPPVQLTDAATGTVHRYGRWPAHPAGLALGRPGVAGNAGPGAPAGWQDQLAGGVDTVATSGPTVVGSTAPYTSPQITLAAVDPRAGATWSTAPAGQDTLVAGTPRLTLEVSASSGSATLFAYLYDVDPGGRAALMGVTPDTITAASAPRPVSVDLAPVCRTIVPGHRLALVIDTVDPRWQSASRPGTVVRLRSVPGAPATLAVPLPGLSGR